MLKKVLIIDDDLITLKICTAVIEKYAFAEIVDTVMNGEEGVNYFKDYFNKVKAGDKSMILPDLILLDLNMPVLNGWDFLEQFIMKYADRLPNTKIVILSSSVDPGDFAKAQRYDIILDFINKPLDEFCIEELKQIEFMQPFFIENTSE
jgi:CheY-like chemotaxis protein